VVVLDASFTLALAFEDERDSVIDAIAAQITRSAITVPAHWPIEVANGLLVAQRRERISVADADRFAAFAATWDVTTKSVPIDAHAVETLPVARQYKLTAYDAAYLVLASAHHLPLATLDRALAKAARALDVDVLGALR
jgi:predicted nucleic acid-binding protein